MLSLSNRRIRTRTYGGVGGAEPRGSPLSRSHQRLRLLDPRFRGDDGCDGYTQANYI
jgi:hypothetical protein